jgi:hypothetical protein
MVQLYDRLIDKLLKLLLADTIVLSDLDLDGPELLGADQVVDCCHMRVQDFP